MARCTSLLMIMLCVVAPQFAGAEGPVRRPVEKKFPAILPGEGELPPLDVPPPQYARPSPTPLDAVPSQPMPPTEDLGVPGYVTSGAQYVAYAGSEAACFLMAYGLFMLPLPFTGVLALVGLALMPGFSALMAVMTGDYVSGQRHALLWTMLAGYVSSGMIVVAAGVAEAALAVAMVLLVRNLYQGASALVSHTRSTLADGGDISGTENDVKALLLRAGVPVVAVGGFMVAAAAVTVVALLLLPPAMTVLSTNMLRSEPTAATQLPRLASTRPSTPVATVAHPR